MRSPQIPPAPAELLSKLHPQDFARIFAHASPLANGKYLHWDELRRRPAPEGLSSEEWWTAVHLARASSLHDLPLNDKTGNPLRFGTPSPVLIDLHHIDRDAAGQIRTPAGMPIQENRNRYLLSSLIEEAITSSQLEGASTTRNVAEAMLREGRKPRDHSEAMIFNNYRAMEHLRELRDETITPQRILELHRMLTEGTLDDAQDAGRLRQTNDVQVIDKRDGSILHQPPPFTELPERLEMLCAFANADESSLPFVHPVLRAILLHFMIGYDHPFVDGNGRTARALFYWSMARSGYWLMEFISISHILRRAPTQYVRAYMHSETDHNDTTYFLIHQLTTIRKAIFALHEYLARKSTEQKDTERLLSSSHALRARFNPRQIALLTHALRNPGEGYRADAHQRTHDVVYQTARTDLLDLESLGLLEKAQRGHAHIFFAPADLRERLVKLA